MASEEERAAILAEYKASVASANNDDDEDDFDEEDEVDFDPDAAFSDEEEADYEEADEAAPEPDYVVLTGSIHLNEEGRIIYSGTWCMKSELDSGTNNNGGVADEKQSKRNHHPKFKLKSQNVCSPPPLPQEGEATNNVVGNKKLFDIRQPTLTNAGEVPTRRIIIFDGFFFAKPQPPPVVADGSTTPKESNGDKSSSVPKKIKERDVELFISLVESEKNSELDDDKSTYRIAGRGQNEYGQFVLDGTYTPPTVFDKHNKAMVICNKTYGVGGTTKETRAAKGSKRKVRSDDDSFDEDFDGEERADYTELIELSEDANLSVEELRKKYYGGGDDDEEEFDEDDDGGGKMSAAKKPRLDEESDDDECGF
mmetsp:Transcript_27153/g.46166  ORF Transcript_27153/g.46166 Transcript_27153/m.46166 type:complete len:368 (+) Transcript_27153:185-1288(+)